MNIFHILLYQPIYNLLVFISWLIPGHSIAIAIIILTIIIRLILLPSSIKTAHLQAKNIKLQPKINKIRNEIKDQQEQSKALMELYKEEGISPFSSCLPLLIQLPVLWVLFAAFKSGLTVDGYKDLYSFIPRPEALNLHFLGFNVTEPDRWILPGIAALIQLILSFMMTPKTPKGSEAANDPSAMMTKQMLILGPAMTFFFGRNFASALVFYWITTNLFSLIQQYYVNKTILHKDFHVGEPVTVTEKKIEKKAESLPVANDKKKDIMTELMNKKLDKAEKKSGVNVVVRTKKK